MDHPVSAVSRVAIITPSYRNDFELARDLCQSIDQHVSPEIEHILVVPKRDLALFGALRSPRRKVVSKEDLLGAAGFRALPLPGRLRIPFLLDRTFREQWWKAGVGRISGWVVQQLVKLSADRLTQAEVLIFADSDALLVRPLDGARFLDQGRVGLHRVPMQPELTEHIGWARLSREVLGLPVDPPVAWEYIGQLISWRRSTLCRLHAHIERVHGAPWQDVIARHRSIAEYMLYGVYCDEVLGEAESGHVAWHNDLTHSIWVQTDQNAAEFMKGLGHQHVAIHLQSTLDLNAAQRQAYVRAAQGT